MISEQPSEIGQTDNTELNQSQNASTVLPIPETGAASATTTTPTPKTTFNFLITDSKPSEAFLPTSIAEQKPLPPLYTTLLLLLSCNEGFVLGIMSIIRIQAIQRGHSMVEYAMYVAALPYLCSFAVSGIVDSRFVERWGKRKAYIVASRVLSSVLLLMLGVVGDSAVSTGKYFPLIFGIFLLNLCTAWENCALAALRFEVFGHSHSSLSAFTHLAGICIGYLFTGEIAYLLSNGQWCKEYGIRGDGQGIIGWMGVLIVVVAVNVGVTVGTMMIKEEKEFSAETIALQQLLPHMNASRERSVSVEIESLSRTLEFEYILTPKKLLRILFTDPIYKKITLWLMLSSAGVIALRTTVHSQLVHRGMSYEHLSMINCVAYLVNIPANYYFMKYIVPGQILRVSSLLLMIYLGILYVELLTVQNFSSNHNYKGTVFTYLISIVLESLCPWISFQFGFVNSTTYPKFAAVYNSTFFSILSFSKISSILVVRALSSFVNYPLLFVILNFGNLIFICFSYNTTALKSDLTTLEELHKPFREDEDSYYRGDGKPADSYKEERKENKPEMKS